MKKLIITIFLLSISIISHTSIAKYDINNIDNPFHLSQTPYIQNTFQNPLELQIIMKLQQMGVIISANVSIRTPFGEDYYVTNNDYSYNILIPKDCQFTAKDLYLLLPIHNLGCLSIKGKKIEKKYYHTLYKLALKVSVLDLRGSSIDIKWLDHYMINNHSLPFIYSDYSMLINHDIDKNLSIVLKDKKIKYLAIDDPYTEKIPELANCPQLKYLTVHIRAKALTPQIISKLRNLELLDIHSSCKAIPKETLIAITKLPKLKYLSINATKTDLTTIAKCKTLLCATLYGSEKSDFIGQISKNNKLKELTIGDYKSLKGCHKLTHLEKLHITVDNKSIKQIAKIKSLKILKLKSEKLTTTSIKKLLNLKQLQELNLTGIKLNDKLCAEFSKFKHLQNLHLSNTQITEACLPYLQQIDTLETLFLCNNKINIHKAVPELMKFNNLKKVILPYESDITNKYDIKLLSRYFELEEKRKVGDSNNFGGGYN